MKIKVEPDDDWKCECGKTHELGFYVAAHWNEKLIHTCECGLKHSIRAGVIETIEPQTVAGRVRKNLLNE